MSFRRVLLLMLLALGFQASGIPELRLCLCHGWSNVLHDHGTGMCCSKEPDLASCCDGRRGDPAPVARNEESGCRCVVWRAPVIPKSDNPPRGFKVSVPELSVASFATAVQAPPLVCARVPLARVASPPWQGRNLPLRL